MRERDGLESDDRPSVGLAAPEANQPEGEIIRMPPHIPPPQAYGAA